MEIPFTVEQFYSLFGRYNEAVWPAPILLTSLAVAAVILISWSNRWSDAGISLILVFLWSWLGIAYHLIFFTHINPLAYVFSALSLAGALIFFAQGVVRHRLRFAWMDRYRSIIGISLISFSLVVYPLWSSYEGHYFPFVPTFGLPCPTTLFTIGILAFLVKPYPRSPFIVPIIWCVIGGQAALVLDVPQDFSLFAAGVIGIGLLFSAGSAGVLGRDESERRVINS